MKDRPTMKNRRHTLLWMKDLLDHMAQCHDQLQWADENDSTQDFLADSLLNNLVECKRLCEELKTPQGRSSREFAFS
jgi:hypothetical protein